MTERRAEVPNLSAVDIVAYPDNKKRGVNHANIFSKKGITMTTTENVPAIGLNNCQDVEVHCQDPNEVIVTSSKNCIIHIYSDKYGPTNQVKQSNFGDLQIDELHNIDCRIVYHDKDSFPNEYTSDTCMFIKANNVTARINAEVNGQIDIETGSLLVGSAR